MAHIAAPSRRLESLAVFATVLRSPAMLRVVLGIFLFDTVEAASWVAILVYAYDQGGATASGLVAFAQLAPAAVFAPLAATLGDRMPRTRMLALAYLLFGLTTLVVGVCLLAGLPPMAVYATVVVSGLALTLVRPAHNAVLPAIARTPSELTAANVASGTMENIGIFAGSVGGGLLLGTIGPGGVFVAGGVAALLAWLAVATLRVAPLEHPVSASVHAGHGHPVHHGSPVHHEHPDQPPPAAVGVRAMGREMLAGLVAFRSNALIRPILITVALSFVLQGAADVLQVVLALDVLGIGEGGVGLLAGAIGVGGLMGSGSAILLVGRRRLLRPLMLAAAVAGLGIAVSGLVPLAAVGLLGYFAAGAGRSLMDVVGRTMLQRVTPDDLLSRVFGLLEGMNMAGLAIGVLLAPLLVTFVGPTASLLAAGALVTLAVVVMRPGLAVADRLGVVHERELAAIRRVPMFAPLRLPVLEHLAAHAQPVHLAAGEVLIREGEVGDCFYVIESGTCSVFIRGRHVNTVGPGDGVGEIALLHDVPRTATVAAVDEMELFGLEREPFLEAVTGHAVSRTAATALVEKRLAAR